MDCHYKWYLGWVERLQPRIESPAPELGSLVHAGLEVAIKTYYSTESLYEANLQAKNTLDQLEEKWLEANPEMENEEEELFDLRELIVPIFRRARDITPRTLEFIDLPKWETVLLPTPEESELLVERPFLVETPYGPFSGTPDWVARDKEKDLTWVIDFKTRKQFTEDEVMNLQMAAYQHMVNREGIMTDGSMLLQIKSNDMTIPGINNDGTISRKLINITWDKYKEFVVEHGQNPNDYRDMEDKLNGLEWFRWSQIYRPPETVNRMWDEILRNAGNIEQTFNYYVDGDEVFEFTPPERQITFTCRFCQYKQLCEAELQDHDAEHIRSEYFKVEELTHEEKRLGPGEIVPSIGEEA